MVSLFCRVHVEDVNEAGFLENLEALCLAGRLNRIIFRNRYRAMGEGCDSEKRAAKHCNYNTPLSCGHRSGPFVDGQCP